MIQSHHSLLFYRKAKVFHHGIRKKLLAYFFRDLLRFFAACSVNIQLNEFADANVPYPFET